MLTLQRTCEVSGPRQTPRPRHPKVDSAASDTETASESWALAADLSARCRASWAENDTNMATKGGETAPLTETDEEVPRKRGCESVFVAPRTAASTRVVRMMAMAIAMWGFP